MYIDIAQVIVIVIIREDFLVRKYQNALIIYWIIWGLQDVYFNQCEIYSKIKQNVFLVRNSEFVTSVVGLKMPPFYDAYSEIFNNTKIVRVDGSCFVTVQVVNLFKKLSW